MADADLPQIAEEIESLGKGEWRAWESRLDVLRLPLPRWRTPSPSPWRCPDRSGTRNRYPLPPHARLLTLLLRVPRLTLLFASIAIKPLALSI